MGEDFDNFPGYPNMLRIFASLFILTACSMGGIKSGGDKGYVYDSKASYTSEELTELAPKIVETSKRDPQVGKLDDLFSQKQKPLKRIGIIIFESKIQTTLEGLAGKDLVYMSEQGKQLMTEKFLSIWEQSIKLVGGDVDYVPTSALKKSKAFHMYGSAENNYVNAKRNSLAPDDIFYLESGKKTTMKTYVNPRGMRDMSFLLVPAYELMAGPKWSEQNKHFVNDVSKELKLDAVIIVLSQAFWTAVHTDKHSGEFIPEEITVEVKASTLIPLHEYHSRLEKLKMNEKPGVTLCYRAYESKLKIPALISMPEEYKNFEAIENEILSPLFKTYKDLSQMTLIRITDDLKKTW
jgi:hypothetical protein